MLKRRQKSCSEEFGTFAVYGAKIDQRLKCVDVAMRVVDAGGRR